MKNLICFSFMLLSLSVSLQGSSQDSSTKSPKDTAGQRNVNATVIGHEVRTLQLDAIDKGTFTEQAASEDPKLANIALNESKPGTLQRTNTIRTMNAMRQAMQQEDIVKK